MQKWFVLKDVWPISVSQDSVTKKPKIIFLNTFWLKKKCAIKPDYAQFFFNPVPNLQFLTLSGKPTGKRSKRPFLKHLAGILFFFVKSATFLNIGSLMSWPKKTELTNQMFEYEILWQLFGPSPLFRTNTWLKASLVILKVSIKSAMMVSNVCENLRLVLYIFGLNWQVRMCCVMTFHAASVFCE